MSEPSQIRVWDPFVRTFHWGLLAAFAVAYITGGEPLFLHVWAGYVIAALIVLRIIWGFAGPKHARFSDFVYAPGTVITYARDLLRRKSRRYVGHSPAGGAMILLLLLSLAATGVTGMATLAETKNAGPLAPWLGKPAAASSVSWSTEFPLISPVLADEDDHEGLSGEGEGKEGHGRNEESAVMEVHEFFANLTLFLAIVHFAGVLFASFAHRENLARSMVTGRKRPEPEAS